MKIQFQILFWIVTKLSPTLVSLLCSQYSNSLHCWQYLDTESPLLRREASLNQDWFKMSFSSELSQHQSHDSPFNKKYLPANEASNVKCCLKYVLPSVLWDSLMLCVESIIFSVFTEYKLPQLVTNISFESPCWWVAWKKSRKFPLLYVFGLKHFYLFWLPIFLL